MAVTINSTPNNWSPSGNPLVYEFTSNQSGNVNFSYIVETLFNGAKVAESRVYPEVSGGKAHIDISETIDALLLNPALSDDLYSEHGTSGLISIKVTEYYGSPPTAQANATSSQTRAFKACISDERFNDVDFDSDWKETKWLTNHPTNNFEVLRLQDAIFCMIVDADCALNVTLRNSAGGVIDSDIFNTTGLKIIRVNLNRQSLIDAGFSSGDIDSAASIDIDIDATYTSETITITYVDADCINPSSLMWVNEYGAFDTFCFKHNRVTRGTGEAKEFGRQFGGWVGTTYTFNPLNSGLRNYAVKSTPQGTLISDYMIQSLHDWLMELYNSPQVILYTTDGSSVAVNLLSRSWEDEQDKFEDLIMEEVEYRYSNVKRSINL